mmetsp:Transcript_14632/g.25003  ORF Transcript_14632/g.25003 Transcript_14632/m.25003 type:complete len:201 (+) Transcript_14632:854-1456(+)
MTFPGRVSPGLISDSGRRDFELRGELRFMYLSRFDCFSISRYWEYKRRFLAAAGSRRFLLRMARSCASLMMRALILGLRESHRDMLERFFLISIAAPDGAPHSPSSPPPTPSSEKRTTSSPSSTRGPNISSLPMRTTLVFDETHLCNDLCLVGLCWNAEISSSRLAVSRTNTAAWEGLNRVVATMVIEKMLTDATQQKER